MRDKELIQTNLIQDGYFYFFDYIPKEYKKGYDLKPFIFCVSPSLTNVNVIRAINLHHLPFNERVKFLHKLDTVYNFGDSDKRIKTSEEALIKLFPEVKQAFRHYNRKRITRCYRVVSDSVNSFAEFKGDTLMANSKDIANNFILNKNKD